MGRVEPGDDMHGTQRMTIQMGTCIGDMCAVAFWDKFFPGR